MLGLCKNRGTIERLKEFVNKKCKLSPKDKQESSFLTKVLRFMW